MHRLGQRLEVRLDAIGQRPRGALRKRQRARPLAAAHERLDLAHRPAVALEALAGFVEQSRFLEAGCVLPQAVQASA